MNSQATAAILFLGLGVAAYLVANSVMGSDTAPSSEAPLSASVRQQERLLVSPAPQATVSRVLENEAEAQELGGTGEASGAKGETPPPVRAKEDLRAQEKADFLLYASELIDREMFIKAVVASEVSVSLPSVVLADATLADRAYWCLVHVLAGQMYYYNDEFMSSGTSLAERARADRARTDVLQSVMARLPDLIRGREVSIAIVNRGGTERDHGNIESGFVGVTMGLASDEIQVSLQRGPWKVQLKIPKKVVDPTLWEAHIAEQKKASQKGG